MEHEFREQAIELAKSALENRKVIGDEITVDGAPLWLVVAIEAGYGRGVTTKLDVQFLQRELAENAARIAAGLVPGVNPTPAQRASIAEHSVAIARAIAAEVSK